MLKTPSRLQIYLVLIPLSGDIQGVGSTMKQMYLDLSFIPGGIQRIVSVGSFNKETNIPGSSQAVVSAGTSFKITNILGLNTFTLKYQSRRFF